MKVGTLNYAYLTLRATSFQGTLPGLGGPSDGWSPGCSCEEASGTGAGDLIRGLESWAGDSGGNVFGNLMSLVGALLGSLGGLGQGALRGGLPGFGDFAGGSAPPGFGDLGGAAPALPDFGASSAGTGLSGTGQATGAAPAFRAPAGSDPTGASGDPALAGRIDDYLAGQGSPAAGRGAGEMMTRWGQEYDVDPLLLLAIAGHETGFGKLGVGMEKMLGVGAFDDNPDGQTHFNGLSTQIEVGAKTFANLREQGGAGPDSSIEDQLRAAGQKWATDPNWAKGVMRHYQQILQSV